MIDSESMKCVPVSKARPGTVIKGCIRAYQGCSCSCAMMAISTLLYFNFFSSNASLAYKLKTNTINNNESIYIAPHKERSAFKNNLDYIHNVGFKAW